MTSGDILLCDLNPVAGREQGGIRPVVVVSHDRYAVIPGLFLAVPLTTRHPELQHHVAVPADAGTGLQQVSYALTEQVRAVSQQRAGRQLGRVSSETLSLISRYLRLFIV
ncbi:MAG TPA: type II toxin-antitoxin system PemK/MazF family toxin [Streptosporangiaceae bacterium]|nr:type II toxin-antitoxin system PemK/MazF family toxin [Streptosporangiaceae bacterium]